MKVIHTSDWHLGQHFMGKSRAREHELFLSWLISQINQYQVDALIVAGDVFDTGFPPSYARQIYNQFVVDIQATGCTLVILGGNHDSVATLGESSQILRCLNTHVVAMASEELSEQVIVLNRRRRTEADSDAPIPGAVLCAIPFLRPRDLLTSQSGQSGADKQQQLLEAIGEHYQKLYAKAEHLAKELAEEFAKEQGDGTLRALPVIASGHMTTVGASTSESVREIYIGTLEAVPASIFPPLDYLALGHIHKPQVVGGLEHMRYSGSPIPLSFDELAQKKSVVLVDFAVHAEQQAQIQLLEVPRFQAMAMIKGDLAQIETQLLGFSGESKDVVESSEANEPLLPVWLDIEVETEDYLSDLQQRIQTLAEGLPVEILLIRRARKQRQAMMAGEAKETLDELNPKEVFQRRLDQEDWESEGLEARRERLNQCFDQALSQLEQGQ